MGASSSKTVVETKVVNEITKEALSKQVSSMAQQTVAVQNMNLSGIDAKCAFEATQNFKGEMKAVQRIEAEDAMNMMNEIVDKIGDQVKQESSRKTGFLGISGFDSKMSETKKSIKNKTKVKLSSEQINKISQQMKPTQNMNMKDITIDPCGLNVYKELGVPPPADLIAACVGQPCKFDQNMHVSFVAEQIGKKITEIIANDKSARDLRTEIMQKTTQESKGLDDLARAMNPFAQMGKMGGIISAISCVLCCVLVIGAGAMSGGGGGGGKFKMKMPKR
jgi:hypothetical protein